MWSRAVVELDARMSSLRREGRNRTKLPKPRACSVPGRRVVAESSYHYNVRWSRAVAEPDAIIFSSRRERHSRTKLPKTALCGAGPSSNQMPACSVRGERVVVEQSYHSRVLWSRAVVEPDTRIFSSQREDRSRTKLQNPHSVEQGRRRTRCPSFQFAKGGS